jgi:hypothetical protein
MESNDESSIGIISSMITISVGVLSWKIYTNPIFRRDFIQGCFNTCDYIYDKYYQLRYDDKIRRKSLLNKDNRHNIISDTQKFVDLIYSSSDEINNCSSCSCSSSSSSSSVLPDSDNEYEIPSNNSSLISSNDSHKLTLIEFFSNELKFESLTYKEKKYYILGTKPMENINENINDKVLDFPWLAASLEIKTLDGDDLTFEITDQFKNFWLEHNQLPLHLEYYDIWITELLLDSNNKFPSKQEIKEIKLTVIDEMGDFMEFNDVLIIPANQDTRFIKLPNLNKLNNTISQNTTDEVDEMPVLVEQTTQEVVEETPVLVDDIPEIVDETLEIVECTTVLVKKTTQEVVEETTQEVVEDTTPEVVEEKQEVVGETQEVVEDTTQDVVEETTQEVVEEKQEVVEEITNDEIMTQC